ncbi:hypothetical protein KY329_01565 [Candidatus Woesearchaeota archaeon]|nr:hypothetical protein [Candidatus Woesearchaeota archaeon]
MEIEKVAILSVLGFVSVFSLLGMAGVFTPTGDAAYLQYYYGPDFKKTSPGYELPAMVPPTGEERQEYFEINTQTTPPLDLYYGDRPEKIIVTLPTYPERNTNWGR